MLSFIIDNDVYGGRALPNKNEKKKNMYKKQN